MTDTDNKPDNKPDSQPPRRSRKIRLWKPIIR
jgi:hypothetical protein